MIRSFSGRGPVMVPFYSRYSLVILSLKSWRNLRSPDNGPIMARQCLGNGSGAHREYIGPISYPTIPYIYYSIYPVILKILILQKIAYMKKKQYLCARNGNKLLRF